MEQSSTESSSRRELLEEAVHAWYNIMHILDLWEGILQLRVHGPQYVTLVSDRNFFLTFLSSGDSR